MIPSQTQGRILVIRGGAIGDFILTLPALRLIRKGFPDCPLEIVGYRHIAALAEGRFYAEAVRSIEYAPMAGFFNPRSELDPGLSEYFSGFAQVISYLYDPDGFFEGNLRRCGVKNLLCADPRVSGGLHAAGHLAKPLESLALFLEDPAAVFFPSPADLDAARAILPTSHGTLVAMHPGSGSPAKNWPTDRWVRLVEMLVNHPGNLHLIVVGGESDSAALTGFRSRFQRSDRLTFLENLPLCTLGACLSLCRLFIGHDSGISHLAAAAGAPSLLLFGPTDPAVWAPANPGVHILRGLNASVGNLSLREVAETVDDLLRD